jgi:AbrB family looped-hinge helix DNA binding protein
MAEAAVTTKGQITIPAEVRAAINLRPGDRVVFTVLDDGTIVFRAKTRALESLAGSLRHDGRPAVPADRMRIGRK